MKRICSFLIFGVLMIATAGCTGEELTTEITVTNKSFQATVLEVQDNTILVEPLGGTKERELVANLLIDTENLAEMETVEYVSKAQAGDIIEIQYLAEESDLSNGEIAVNQMKLIKSATKLS